MVEDAKVSAHLENLILLFLFLFYDFEYHYAVYIYSVWIVKQFPLRKKMNLWKEFDLEMMCFKTSVLI